MAGTARNARSGGSQIWATTTRTLTREQVSTVDLTELSPRVRAIALTLGRMLSHGYSKQEIAVYYGKSRPWVSARFRELAEALREQIARADRV